MLHGQRVVAKVIRRLAEREVQPHALGRFQPGVSSAASIRAAGHRHRCGHGAAADQIVVAS